MKKTTCMNLAGACEEIITGSTPEEMGENSKNHAIKMVQSGDVAHKKAMEDMMAKTPEEQQKWYKDFVDNFDSLDEA